MRASAHAALRVNPGLRGLRVAKSRRVWTFSSGSALLSSCRAKA